MIGSDTPLRVAQYVPKPGPGTGVAEAALGVQRTVACYGQFNCGCPLSSLVQRNRSGEVSPLGGVSSGLTEQLELHAVRTPRSFQMHRSIGVTCLHDEIEDAGTQVSTVVREAFGREAAYNAGRLWTRLLLQAGGRRAGR